MFNPIFNQAMSNYQLAFNSSRLKGMTQVSNIFKGTEISPLLDHRLETYRSYTPYNLDVDRLYKSLGVLNQTSRNVYNSSQSVMDRFTLYQPRTLYSSDPNLNVSTLEGAPEGTFQISVQAIAKQSTQSTALYSKYANFQSTTGVRADGSFSIQHLSNPAQSLAIDLASLGITSSSNVENAFQRIADEINSQSAQKGGAFIAEVVEDGNKLGIRIASADTGVSTNFKMVDTEKSYKWTIYNNKEVTHYAAGSPGAVVEKGPMDISGHTSFTFDAATGTYSTAGTEMTYTESDLETLEAPVTLYRVSGDGKTLTKIETDANSPIYETNQGVDEWVTNHRGTNAGTTTGHYTDFDHNVRNADGKWYVRGGLTPTQDIDQFFSSSNYSAGVNANYTIDGEQLQSEKNTVTFNKGYGTIELTTPLPQATVTIGFNAETIARDIERFIADVNEVSAFLDANRSYIRKDTVQSFEQLIDRNQASLAEIGITMDRNRQLSIHQPTLLQALRTDAKKVEEMFGAASGAFAAEARRKSSDIVNTPIGTHAPELLREQRPHLNHANQFSTMTKLYTDSLLLKNGFFLDETF